MQIYECNVGDQFYWDDCVWSVTGNVERVGWNLFRECYNHDTRQIYSLPSYAFKQFKPTPWSVK